MQLRIQPREICVPTANPFQNDRLGRKDSANALTHILRSIAGPCVLAIDAGWGNGKTTFVNMWAQHLRNEEFVVAHFNAWKTDYCGDPFIALSAELTDSLHLNPDVVPTAKMEAYGAAAQKVVLGVMSETVRRATAGLVDPSSVVEALHTADTRTTRISTYREIRKTLLDFKASLRDLVNSLSDPSKSQPVVVVIDELDRCRPAYAVELLEVAKHLFDVDEIVFVISVNRTQLANSIRAVYGKDFDANGYLRRFFDIDFRLPDASRDALVKMMLSNIEFREYVRRADVGHDVRDIENMLHAFFSPGYLSVRDVVQAMRRLELVLAAARQDHKTLLLPVVVAVVLRTLDADLYQRFLSEGISDKALVDKILTKSGMDHLGKARSREGYEFERGLFLFEDAIIDFGREIHGYRTPYVSELVEHYKEEVGADSDGNVPSEARYSWAGRMVQSQRRRFGSEGYLEAVKRIELVSASFDVAPEEY